MKKLVFLSLLIISAVYIYAEDIVASPPADTVLPASNAAAASTETPTPAPATTPSPAAVTVTTPSPTATPAATKAATPVTASNQDSYNFESDHYSVRSFVSADNAQSLALRLEAYQIEYNKFFHFDINKTNKLKVRIFDSKQRFDQYLQRLINETRDDYVYLHYSDAARSELVGYTDPKLAAPEASIAHQAFIQFLRANIANPPLWLREGFAVFFEELAWDPIQKTATLHENLSWLETLKDLEMGSRTAEALSMTDLLTISVDKAREKIQVFYPQAWALVNYLARSENKNHNRILWDSIAQMNPTASLDENSALVQAKAFKWAEADKLKIAFDNYFQAKKTYRELIQDGIDQYANGKPKDSEASFTLALGLQDASYVPYYYLGLLNYDRGAYTEAEGYYQKALEKGASPALTNYALGVNAFADNRFDVAAQYLKKTGELDPSFKDKVNELIQRMDS